MPSLPVKLYHGGACPGPPAKYDELIRIREEEAAAKEELTQELRAELEAVKAQQAKEHAEHQEAMAQVTAFAKALPAEGDTISRVLANEVVAGRSRHWLVRLPKPWRRRT